MSVQEEVVLAVIPVIATVNPTESVVLICWSLNEPAVSVRGAPPGLAQKVGATR